MKISSWVAVLPLLLAACSSPSPGAEVPHESVAPQPTSVFRVSVEGLPIIGKADALVTVVLFTDYECPFCRKVDGVLAELRALYGDDLRIAVAERPLPFHPHARAAALAALAAGEQGRFEAMHGRLVALDTKVDDDTIQTAAREAGLDMGRFEADRTGERGAKWLSAADKLSNQFGAVGTPTLIINGRAIVGSQLERIRRTVAEEMESAKARVAKGASRLRLYESIVAGGVDHATREELGKESGTIFPGPMNGTPSVPETELSKALRAHKSDAKACYESILAAAGGAVETTTEVTLTVQVKADGTLGSVTAAPDSALATCLAERARAWTFGPGDKDYTLRIPYKFVSKR